MNDGVLERRISIKRQFDSIELIWIDDFSPKDSEGSEE
jgi:hypothetical protein